MSETVAMLDRASESSAFVQLLDLACGGLLLTAVLVLWRRELAVIIRMFALQGVALAALVAVLAAHERSVELWAVAGGVLVLRALVLPYLLRRALASAGEARRETRPVVNVAASLLAAAVLTLLAYAASRPLVELAPSPVTSAIPVGFTVVLIGFFVLVTRRRALSQLVGFLLMDNGITAVGFLTTSGVGLVVELGVSLDVLLAVLVLQVLTARMRETFGDTDLDELRELHD
jgi:hydrogenase-4 component E